MKDCSIKTVEEIKHNIALIERKLARAKAEALSWARERAINRFNYPANKPIPAPVLLRIADTKPEVIELEKELDTLLKQLHQIELDSAKLNNRETDKNDISIEDSSFYTNLMNDVEFVINCISDSIKDVREIVDKKDVRSTMVTALGAFDSSKIWHKIMENMTVNISNLSDCMDCLRRVESLSHPLNDSIRHKLLTERVKDLKADAKLFLDLAKHFSFNYYE